MNRLSPIKQLVSWIPDSCFTIIILILFLGISTDGAANEPEPSAGSFPGKITFLDGKLTAQIVSASLRQVMEEVSKLSGARVHWQNHDDGNAVVSVEFNDLPFSDALKRILGEKNFIFFYASTNEVNNLPQVWILSKKSAEEHLALTPLPSSEENSLIPSDDSRSHVVQDNDTLIEIALYDQDHLERLDAITRLGGYAQEDQGIKMILSQVAESDSNQQVREAAKELLQNMEKSER